MLAVKDVDLGICVQFHSNRLSSTDSDITSAELQRAAPAVPTTLKLLKVAICFDMEKSHTLATGGAEKGEDGKNVNVGGDQSRTAERGTPWVSASSMVALDDILPPQLEDVFLRLYYSCGKNSEKAIEAVQQYVGTIAICAPLFLHKFVSSRHFLHYLCSSPVLIVFRFCATQVPWRTRSAFRNSGA